MKTENLNYRDGDLNLQGLVAYDETATGRRPGVVIMPDAFGIGPLRRRYRRSPGIALPATSTRTNTPGKR